MSIRKKSGNVTAFAVGCVMILVIIGLFAYKFTTILGGDEQVQHACDAGTLNFARAALVMPQVPLSDPAMIQTSFMSGLPMPYSDFFACIGETSADNSQSVNLSNINRILAQALIVADTAETLGTPEAKSHADDVIWAAGNLATYLRYQLCPLGLIPPNATAGLISAYEGSWAPGQTMPPLGTNSSLQQAFSNLAQDNSLNMLLGKSPPALQFSSETVSWVPGSASIYVDPSTVSSQTYASLPINSTSPLKPTLGYTPATPFTPSYLKGYQLAPLPGISVNNSIAFVADRPQQNTSLVSLSEFDANVGPLIGQLNGQGILVQNLAYLPPNSFEITSQTQANTSAQLSSLACAVIGSVNNGNVACIPAGYIAINNLPAAAPSSSAVVSSGASADLFNSTGAAPFATWLSAPVLLPSIGQTASLFNTSLPGMFEWLTFAQSEGYTGANAETVDGKKYNPTLDPLRLNNDRASNHQPTDVIDTSIRIATTNAPAAELRDLMALGKSSDYNYTFKASDFNLTTKSQLETCLGITKGNPTKIQQELDELVVGTTVNPKSIFPMMDESINGKERKYIDEAIAPIQAYLGKDNIGAVAASLFPDGLDVVAKLKFELMGARGGVANGNPSYTLKLVGNALSTDKGLQVKVNQSGMLVVKDLFEKDPYATTKAVDTLNAYLVHHSIWANYDAKNNTEVIETPQYAYSPAPSDALGAINKVRNGPVHYDLTSTSNGVTTSTGDHSFNPSDGTFNNFINAIWKQCLKIKPGATQNEVLQALGFGVDGNGQVFLPTNSSAPQVKLGGTAYLYENPTTGLITCASSLPYVNPNAPAETPDGGANSQLTYNTGWVLVSGSAGGHDPSGIDQEYNSLINTSTDLVSNLNNGGASDDAYHLAMWEKEIDPQGVGTPNGLQMQYQATFTPSSGYHNFLGEITIVDQVKDVLNQGGVSFTNPN